MTPVHSGTQTEDPQHVSSSRGSGSLPIAQRDTIDVVYTWVYGQDVRWQTDFRTYVGEAESDPLAKDLASRYFCRDALRYSLRSLQLYAPFVRHVYLVTANQVPAWLDRDHPDLTLISHSEIFPNPDHLPTFNSHAIETHLHAIAGLSERFLYMNDDVFFARRTHADDFFDATGRPIVYIDKRKVPWNRSARGYHRLVSCAARNNSRFLEERFDFRITHRVDHVPYALRKSTMDELWSLLPKELDQTSANRTRNPADFSLPSSLAPYYGLCTGTYVAETRNQSTYIKVKAGRWNRLKTYLRISRSMLRRSSRRKFLSVNDAGDFDDSPLTARVIRALLERRYLHASRFEKPTETGQAAMDGANKSP